MAEQSMLLLAGPDESRESAQQIVGLLTSLSDHSASPADVLDPNLGPSDREKNLRRLSASRYVLSLVPSDGIPPITGGYASVPVRVHFDDGNGNSLDANATVQFVERDGKWYFSNFHFLEWPGFLVLVLILGVLAGVTYAGTVLILANRLLKQGALGADGLRMFVPLFWPYLFRKLRTT